MELIREFQAYLRSRAMSEITIRCYGIDLCEFLKSHPNLLQVTASDLQRYCDQMTGRLAANTIHRKRSALRTFYKWASQSKNIENPCQSLAISLPKPTSEPTTEVLTDVEVNLLLISINGGWNFLSELIRFRDQSIISLLVHSGLRVDEVADLKNKDLNLHNTTIDIVGKNQRTVDLQNVDYLLPFLRHKSVLEEDTKFPRLWNLFHLDPDDYLFKNHRGEKLSTRSVRRKIEYYSRTTLGREICPTTLRYTFAHRYLRDGGNLKSLLGLLGIKSFASHLRYRKLNNRINPIIELTQYQV